MTINFHFRRAEEEQAMKTMKDLFSNILFK